jgi:hypothetical protein
MSEIVVRPDLHTQFASRMPRFCLITDEGNPLDLGISASNLYRECLVLPLREGESLAQLLQRAPREADLLAVTPRTFLSSPTNDQIGPDRRLSILPCASTPVTTEQLRYFLRVCEETDQQSLHDACTRIVQALEVSEHVQLTDSRHGTTAVFDAWHDYEWNQQAGPIAGGEQQIAPGGELSAVPVEITRFDKSARLRLSGQLTLHGSVIVHRNEAASSHEESGRVYQELAVLDQEALIMEIDAGVITDLRPAGAEAKPAQETLEQLFSDDDSYRVIWEFGLGLNTAMRPVKGNCGMNEMYGGTQGLLHIGLGLTPSTLFALTFQCGGTTVLAGDTVLAGPARRTLRRQRSAACGCAEGARR